MKSNRSIHIYYFLFHPLSDEREQAKELIARVKQALQTAHYGSEKSNSGSSKITISYELGDECEGEQRVTAAERASARTSRAREQSSQKKQAVRSKQMSEQCGASE